VEANAIVTTDDFPAVGALPFLLFLFQKAIDAPISYRFEIGDHTRPERGFVSLIKMDQIQTREVLAFIAVLDPVIK
jgi:hypothetical protein